MQTLTNRNTIQTIGKFSLPIIGGNLLQQCYPVVNAIIIGRFSGTQGLSAIGVAGSIISFLTFIIFGLGIGMTVLLSKYYGTDNKKKFRHTASTALITGFSFTVLLSLSCLILASPILTLFQTPPAIFQSSLRYFQIMCLGLLFAFLYNYYNSLLLARGNSRLPFFVLSIATVINIFLTYTLAVPFSLGVTGAALASVLSQALSVLLCVLYLSRNEPQLKLKRQDLVIDLSCLRETVGYSSASALQQLLFNGGKLAIQGAVNTLGISIIAGYTSALQIEAFIMAALEGIATTVSRNCANRLGCRRESEIATLFFAGLAISLACTAVTGMFLWFTAPALMALFAKSGEAEALQSGVIYLQYMALFYLALSGPQILQALFRGIGRMDIAIYATLLQMLFRVGATYLLFHTTGVAAIAMGSPIGRLAMGLYEGITAIRYFRAHRTNTICAAPSLNNHTA